MKRQERQRQATPQREQQAGQSVASFPAALADLNSPVTISRRSLPTHHCPNNWRCQAARRCRLPTGYRLAEISQGGHWFFRPNLLAAEADSTQRAKPQPKRSATGSRSQRLRMKRGDWLNPTSHCERGRCGRGPPARRRFRRFFAACEQLGQLQCGSRRREESLFSKRFSLSPAEGERVGVRGKLRLVGILSRIPSPSPLPFRRGEGIRFVRRSFSLRTHVRSYGFEVASPFQPPSLPRPPAAQGWWPISFPGTVQPKPHGWLPQRPGRRNFPRHKRLSIHTGEAATRPIRSWE